MVRALAAIDAARSPFHQEFARASRGVRRSGAGHACAHIVIRRVSESVATGRIAPVYWCSRIVPHHHDLLGGDMTRARRSLAFLLSAGALACTSTADRGEVQGISSALVTTTGLAADTYARSGS